MAISPSVLTPEPSHVEKVHRPAEVQAPILAQPLLATTPWASYLTPLESQFLHGVKCDKSNTLQSSGLLLRLNKVKKRELQGLVLSVR